MKKIIGILVGMLYILARAFFLTLAFVGAECFFLNRHPSQNKVESAMTIILIGMTIYYLIMKKAKNNNQNENK